MVESSLEESDRRQSFRLDMEKELVDIVWINDNNQEQVKKIACLDFSRGGLRLDCDQALAVHTAITIIFKSANTNNKKLHGKVLRCIKQDSGWYEIAVTLDKKNTS